MKVSSTSATSASDPASGAMSRRTRSASANANKTASASCRVTTNACSIGRCKTEVDVEFTYHRLTPTQNGQNITRKLLIHVAVMVKDEGSTHARHQSKGYGRITLKG